MARDRECLVSVLAGAVFIGMSLSCCGQTSLSFKRRYYEPTPATVPPLPFSPCRADDIACLRRGLRAFFFLMDEGHLGMMPVDPATISSVAVSMPEQDMSLLMRKINVTGARWTKLGDRKFNLPGGKSGVQFYSDLHVTAEISLSQADQYQPLFGYITMDIQDVESNVTYNWYGERGYDQEDYLQIGAERIAVRNTRVPTFFMQPSNEETVEIEQVLSYKPSLLEHLSNEITSAVMHNIIDNFRLFASKVPVRYYYNFIA